MNLFAQAAHAPLMSIRLDARLFSFIPAPVKQGLTMLPPVRRIISQVLDDLGIPVDVLGMFIYPTRFENRVTDTAHIDSCIVVKLLHDYVWVIWGVWLFVL